MISSVLYWPNDQYYAMYSSSYIERLHTACAKGHTLVQSVCASDTQSHRQQSYFSSVCRFWVYFKVMTLTVCNHLSFITITSHNCHDDHPLCSTYGSQFNTNLIYNISPASNLIHYVNHLQLTCYNTAAHPPLIGYTMKPSMTDQLFYGTQVTTYLL